MGMPILHNCMVIKVIKYEHIFTKNDTSVILGGKVQDGTDYRLMFNEKVIML